MHRNKPSEICIRKLCEGKAPNRFPILAPLFARIFKEPFKICFPLISSFRHRRRAYRFGKSRFYRRLTRRFRDLFFGLRAVPPKPCVTGF